MPHLPHLIDRFRFLTLFILLILFCFMKALHAELGWLNKVDIIFAILIASCVLIIGNKKNLLFLLIALLILIDSSLIFLQAYYDSVVIEALKLSFAIIFLMVMGALCLFFTLQDKTISLTTLFGSLSAYFFIGLIFAYIYLLIEILSPHSFSTLPATNESKAIYFSFITLTTVGFGEIIPLKPIAQTFVWLESFMGQSYLAVIIGQLIGRYVAK